jgi:hypothetical protein
MSKSEEFRSFARECFEVARRAGTELERQVLFEMGNRWWLLAASALDAQSIARDHFGGQQSLPLHFTNAESRFHPSRRSGHDPASPGLNARASNLHLAATG